ncbi:bifunctional diaminohydroxyphosphoribosylaminopyrimidine deaminase/5-amino-6-(5-phosphoribosylamino)uracil reductase RibD [Candidatus Zixiibacteriota bacterium]
MTDYSSSASASPDRHSIFMRQALDLALLGRWTAPPNPAVGAVVVLNDTIVGQGYHERPGTPHAEVVALESAGADSRGATLYVTLEPCNHHGRTPPCTEAILEAGIQRVVVAAEDPCRHDCDAGIERLREQAVEVISGVEGAAASQLNARYFLASRDDRPIVIAKSARTLDGRTMGPGRKPLAVTGSEALEQVGCRRSEVDAILIGSGTVLADDPRLSARRVDGSLLDRQPVRVVADGRLRMSPQARIVTSPGGPVWVLTSRSMLDSPEATSLKDAGTKLIGVPLSPDGGLDEREMLESLRDEGVSGLMIEGGGSLLSSFSSSDLIDHWEVWIAPRVTGLGGGMLVSGIEPPLQLGDMRVWEFGEDLLVRALPETMTTIDD